MQRCSMGEAESGGEGNGREWLTLTELANVLGVSRSTLYRAGVVDLGLQIGGCRRYRVQDVLDALEYGQSE